MPPKDAAWNRVQVAVGYRWDAIPTFSEVAAKVEAMALDIARLKRHSENLNKECETHAARVRQLEREREVERGPGLKPEPAPITCDIGAYYE